jgi:hypothetical protein
VNETITQASALRQFSTAQAARLLGLQKSMVASMRGTGEGPEYTGVGEYVSYREDHVKLWALENVLAPTGWFERFDGVDPRNADRCELTWVRPYYVLGWYYQRPFIKAATRGWREGRSFELYAPSCPPLIAAQANAKRPI